MELLFKKYFWILNSVLLVGGGFATSRAFSSYVEYELFKPHLVEHSADEEQIVEEEDFQFRRPIALRSVDLERRRQLAAAAAGTENKEEPEIAKVEEETPPDVTPAEESNPAEELDLELIATITSTDDAGSLALVRIDSGDSKWVGIGDELKSGYTVTKISNYYVMASQGVTELLWKKREEKPPKAMLAGGRGGPPRTPAKGAKKKKAKKKGKKPKSNKYAEGIKQTGPFEYTIDRGMLNEQLQDLAKLGREARVIPNYDKDSGTYKGFKLIGVRPNSLYRAIGIRSGDVIQRINGEELSSPGKALELFTQLQNSSNIALDLGRRGKQHTMTYKIE